MMKFGYCILLSVFISIVLGRELQADQNSTVPATKAVEKIKPPVEKIEPLVDPATLPSNLYQNLELGKYYQAEMVVNETEKKKIYNHTGEGNWTYFSIDVKKTLGSQLKVSDPKSVLSQLRSDIKIANVSQYQDLIIEVLDDGAFGFSNPDMYINLNDSLPSRWHFNVSCRFYGEDVCVISGKDLEAANTTHITVGVNCGSDCKFKIQAELEAEISLLPNKMHNIYFKENQQRIFKFAIPNDTSIERIDFRGISENKFAKFEMLIVQGNQVPDTHRALILTPAWENGYLGKFYKGCYCYCIGCNYTMLVTTKSEGYINIGGKTSGDYLDLNSYPGGIIYDAVPWWNINCYNYTVASKEKDFSLTLQVYTGNPDLYVSPLVPITNANYTSAKYNSKDHFWNEELVLNPEIRKELGGETGPYFICVYGGQYSTYKLTAKNEDHTNMLSAGLSESGYIDSNKTKTFYYTDRALIDIKAKLKYNVHVMSGIVKASYKACPRPKNMANLTKECFLTEKELMEDDPNEKVQEHTAYQEIVPDHNLCYPNELIRSTSGMRNNNTAECVYAFAITSMSNFTSHYSLMVEVEDDSGKNHPIVLSEGTPFQGIVKFQEDKYFTITIEDANVTDLSVQLTSLHGDADMMASRTIKNPNRTHWDVRSEYAGLFPDVISWVKQGNKTLVGNYYIAVDGDEESQYIITYYTKTGNNTVGTQKLMVGKKQSGILHPNLTVSNAGDLSDQPSLSFHFQVPREMLDANHSVQVRLRAEHGQFIYLVCQGQLPVPDDESLYGERKGCWSGFEYKDVEIKADQLDKTKLHKNEDQPQIKRTTSGEMIDFYATVWPYIDPSSRHWKAISYRDEGKDLAFQFDLAFYDEEDYVQLSNGMAQRGVATSQKIDYFFFDIPSTEHDVEITLSQISGATADLVLSLNPENKYPTLTVNDFNSEIEFTTDSIILTKEMLEIQKERNQIKTKHMKAYIGVYASGDLSVYSLLVLTKTDFQPIRLKMSEIQAGRVGANEKRFYFVKTGLISQNSKPIKIDMMPVNGNPDLEVTLISNLTGAKETWKKLSQKPTYTSSNKMGIESLILDPSTNEDFRNTCAHSCVVLISVTNNQPSFTATPGKDMRQFAYSFKIQVSQNFQSLNEKVKVQGELKEASGTGQDKADLSRYNFYKFYKACDLECDLFITVVPTSGFGNLTNVLINYENPLNRNTETTQLPTWSTSPAWTASLKAGASIRIEGAEPYFFENHGRRSHMSGQAAEIKPSSKGYYYIGVQSYSQVKYTIEVRTRPHNASTEFDQDSDEAFFDIDPAYLGLQDTDIYLDAGRTKYFYFQNWREQPVKFRLQLLNQNFGSRNNVQMSVGQGRANRKVSNRPPRHRSELPEHWVDANETQLVEFSPMDDNFCMFCTYVIRIKNTHGKSDKDNKSSAKLNLIIEQSDRSGDANEANEEARAAKIILTPGRPQPVLLNRHQKVTFYWPLDHESNEIEIEVLLGDAKVKLFNTTGKDVLREYPCPMNSSHHIKDNIIKFDLKDMIPTVILNKNYFVLSIESTAEILKATAYLRARDSLDVLPDGKVHHFEYVLSQSTKTQPKPQYFMYLPSNHKEELLISAQLKSFQSELWNMFTDSGKDETAQEEGSEMEIRFFNFKVALKKLRLRDNVHGGYVKWTDEFTHDEQFDYVFESKNSNTGVQMFKALSMELDPMIDIILVKVEGIFDYSQRMQLEQASLTMSLQISSSDVSYLPPDTVVRNVVSDDPNKFKVYEFYVNELQFPKGKEARDGVDLFVTLTPCTGLLRFYISDDYHSLFKEKSEIKHDKGNSQLDLNSTGSLGVRVIHKQSKVNSGMKDAQLQEDSYSNDFGLQGKRLEHVERIKGKKIYIGVRAEDGEEVTRKAVQEIKGGRPSRRGRPRTHIAAKFSPVLHAFSKGEDHMSVFEMSASFIGTNKPDELDMYQLQDPEYGIKIDNVGRGQGGDRHIRISWSSLMKQETEDVIPHYSEMSFGVMYKLYLGYNDQTLDLFSSLCQLEETEMVVDQKKGSFALNGKKRCLQSAAGQPRNRYQAPTASEFIYETPDLKVLKAYGDNFVIIKGNDALKNAKSAVVMAHIFREGKPPLALAYSPVDLDKNYDFDKLLYTQKNKFVFISLVVFLAAAGFMVWAILSCSAKRAQREAERDVSENGITMREMPTHSTNPDETVRSSQFRSNQSFGLQGDKNEEEEFPRAEHDEEEEEIGTE